MQIITAEQVVQTLHMRHCIELMKTALIALAHDQARQIVRPVLPLFDRNVLGMMPAFDAARRIAGVKILTVFPNNYEKNVPSHQGHVVVFETETGSVKAIVDAESITGIRTAAASAAVTDVLARPDASRLAILGAGLQGRRHLEAIMLVRPLTEVTVWDIRPDAAARYPREMTEKTGLPIWVSADVNEACRDADIICTLTPAKEPILVRVGCEERYPYQRGRGMFPRRARAAPDLMAAGRLFVDWKPAALVEAGDYVLAVQDGVLTEDHILGEAGQVLAGDVPERASADDITIFEALGQAVQDLIAADYVAEALRAHD